jgi:hypothetical protein
MNTHEQLYTDSVSVAQGGTVNGKSVTFPISGEKPSCLNAFIQYTPGVANRTLDVKLQLATQNGVFYSLLSDNTVTITDDAVVQLSIPGAPTIIRLTYTSSGPAGADDTVSVILSGLPQGTVIL